MRTILIFLILFLALFLISNSLFAMDVYVAPILHVDETQESNRGANTTQADLLQALQRTETGVVLRFSSVRDSRINPPQSLTDAVSVCRNEQINYLLYGYVTRRSHSVQMEIRLFDFENRSVMQAFFGMDDSGNYERLVSDIARKIIEYIASVFNLESLLDRIEHTRLSIPLSTGYWTPIQSDWIDVMFGTVSATTGLNFTPTDNLFTIKGVSWYLSTGLNVKYRLGLGNKERYEAYIHTLYLTLPLELSTRLTRQHELFYGLGFVYFLDFFIMADKYSESKTHFYYNFGFNANFGYRFNVNNIVSLFFRNDFDFLFNENNLFTYSPSIGVSFHIFTREVRNRW